MAGPIFDDLIANRTLTPEIAQTLIAAARAKRSFLVFAQPRSSRAMQSALPPM